MVTGPNAIPSSMPILVGVGVLFGALGALGLRWGIVANQEGFTLSGTTSTARIRWSTLKTST